MSAPPEQQPERLLPDTWRRPVLGVLGGMGPAATVSFLDALVRATPAAVDQEHIDVVVLSHASVPDRTARLLDPTLADPTDYLLRDLELLARLGVDGAVIACNTSHAFLAGLELPLPLLSIIEVGAQAAVAAARAADPSHPVVTVLATDGTLLSSVYQDAITRRGVEVRLPDEAGQRRVMSLIYDGVKAGVDVPTDDFFAHVQELRRGDDAVLLGCTELSVLSEQALLEHRSLPPHVLDAQAALVERVVQDFSIG
ncbi:MAG: amino acid racemase [Ornithinimicrobium sp.]|uniref:aspartate/glutamate racemase family protein n=1 Tax=Ornithinimicrobium sp. TaxID=1977084 RepID=UPI0026E0F174|nr:amino acid racemase [Ornithinimicrobium sp.]MDO5739938.1 amino acid racemase [Ornithinimicrobium sp.]